MLHFIVAASEFNARESSTANGIAEKRNQTRFEMSVLHSWKPPEEQVKVRNKPQAFRFPFLMATHVKTD
jgi:hypothetical protein